MKIYIAGKITGDPYYKAKFARAAADIADAGHTPINPALQPEGMSNADYMRISFAQLDSADAVAFLPDWEDSKGAQLEHLWVEYTGKPTYDINSACTVRWTTVATANGKIRMTRREVMDALHRCADADSPIVACENCPLHDVDACSDVLSRAAYKLLQGDDMALSHGEGDHGK